MSSREQLLNIVFIFVVAMALGSLLGLSILRTVDKRMSDISINIPEIKIPPAQVKVNCPSDYLSNQSFYQQLESNYQMRGGDYLNKEIESVPAKVNNNSVNRDPDGKGIYQGLAKNIHQDNLTVKPIPNIEKESRDKRDKGKKEIAKGITERDDSKNSDVELRNNNSRYFDYPDESVDFVRSRSRINNENHYLAKQQLESHKSSLFKPIHPKESYYDIDHYRGNAMKGDELRNCGVNTHSFYDGNYYDRKMGDNQYYKNPNEMDIRQLIKFKKSAKFDKMTLTDYINWLSLYINDDSEVLSFKNQQNLLKLLQKREITEKDIPRDEILPKTSRDAYYSIIE